MSSLFAAELAPVPTKDRKVVRRWSIAGDPRGVAVGADGTIYVGLAGTQSIAAIHPQTGALTPTGHTAKVPTPVCIRFVR